jgi:hypothetical protein
VLRQQLHNTLLDQVHQLAYSHTVSADIHQQVDHPLARAVIGDLPAPVYLDHRDIPRRQHMLGLARLPLGEDPGMLQ